MALVWGEYVILFSMVLAVMTMPAVSKGKGGYYTGNDPDACKDIASDLSLPVLPFTELVCTFILARFP